MGDRHPRLLPMTNALAPSASGGDSYTRFSRVFGAAIHTSRTGPRSYIHFVVMIIHTFHYTWRNQLPAAFLPGNVDCLRSRARVARRKVFVPELEERRLQRAHRLPGFWVSSAVLVKIKTWRGLVGMATACWFERERGYYKEEPWILNQPILS